MFLHGMNESRQSWTLITELLPDHLQQIRADFRGHGASSRARAFTTPSTCAAFDVGAVVVKRPVMSSPTWSDTHSAA